MNKIFLPNLFILGAAKSGTTSLHNYLSQYDNICMSYPKEPFFFEAEYEKGLEYYKDKYFSHYKGEKIIGESRHRNLFLPFVPNRIKKINPNAKLIVLLRNPVERTYSHWWQWYSRDIERRSFSKAIRDEIKLYNEGIIDSFFSNPELYAKNLLPHGEATITSYVLSSIYVEQVERYLNLFPFENIMFIFFEKLVSNPEYELKRLMKWLLNSEKLIGSFTNENPTKKKDLKGLILELNKLLPIKQILPNKVIQSIKKSMLYRKPMKDKDRKMLLDFFAPFNKKLESLIKEDLSFWER